MSKTMEIVVNNIKTFFEKENYFKKAWHLREPSLRLRKATGLSRRELQKLLGHENEVKIANPRNQNRFKLDNFNLGIIRSAIHQRYLKNERVSIDVLAGDLRARDVPAVSRSCLRKCVLRLGFRFYKNGTGKRFARERVDVVAWRHDFLRRVTEARESGDDIVYVDETWVNANHCCKGEWSESRVSDASKLLVGDQSRACGRCIPSGKGKRLIVLDAGCRGVGLIPEVGEMFEAKHEAGDYHSEMNHEHFFDWWKNTLLPALPGPSTIVIDNAPYHSMMTDSSRSPTTASTKDNIKLWLTGRGLTFTDDMVKAELLDIVRRNKPRPLYIVDELALQAGHRVLRLPPRHCELNPIELVWAEMKGYVARNNSTFKLADTKALFLEAKKNITPEIWDKCEDHVINKVEREFWRADGVQEEEIAPVVIDLNDESDSDFDLSDDEDTDTETDDHSGGRGQSSHTSYGIGCSNVNVNATCARLAMDDSDKENDLEDCDNESDVVCKFCKLRDPPADRLLRKRKGKREVMKEVEWIFCDGCDCWFHVVCQNVKSVNVNVWLCNVCEGVMRTSY